MSTCHAEKRFYTASAVFSPSRQAEISQKRTLKPELMALSKLRIADDARRDDDVASAPGQDYVTGRTLVSFMVRKCQILFR